MMSKKNEGKTVNQGGGDEEALWALRSRVTTLRDCTPLQKERHGMRKKKNGRDRSYSALTKGEGKKKQISAWTNGHRKRRPGNGWSKWRHPDRDQTPEREKRRVD